MLPINVQNFLDRIVACASKYNQHMSVQTEDNVITIELQHDKGSGAIFIAANPDTQTFDVEIGLIEHGQMLASPVLSTTWESALERYTEFRVDVAKLSANEVFQQFNPAAVQDILEFQQLIQCIITDQALSTLWSMLSLTITGSLLDTYQYSTVRVINQTPSFIMAVKQLCGEDASWADCIDVSPLETPTKLLSVPSDIEDTPTNRALTDVYRGYVDAYQAMAMTQTVISQDSVPSTHMIGYCLVDSILFIVYNYRNLLNSRTE